MDQTRFEGMVARLEIDSAQAPGVYQFKVALLALIGFGVLALILAFAGLGLTVIAGILIAILVTGGKALLLLIKLGKLLILLAIPLWVLIRASISALFTRLPAPAGTEITEAQAPALFAAMSRMRTQMKGPKFHHVLITDEVNAAVVQRPLFGLFGWPRNYLILGLPLLESVTPDEALAIVAHEYGHLAGAHAKFGAYIYRLRNSWGTISAVAQQWTGWTGRRLQAIVGWYAPYFNAYTFVLARTHEYQADAASAELVGAPVAASALKRVNVISAKHQHFFDSALAHIGDQPTPPTDMAFRWAEVAQQPVEPQQAEQWLQKALEREPHVADTHPALKLRLNALIPDHAQIGQLPDLLQGETAAQKWLGAHLPNLRAQFQEAWAERVSAPWSERHEAIQVQKQRLQALIALASPSVDEQCEANQLRIQLQPEAENLPALQAFNEAHPEHALGLFLEADWRLSKGDDTALSILDKVMQLDPASIKTACNRAWAFLMDRNDKERAKPYQEAWQRRHEWEETKHRQMSNLDVSHALQPASDLSAEQRQQMHTNVQKCRKGIKRAYLAKRVLPIDPDQLTYVVGLELTAWASFRKKGPAIVAEMADLTWPEHVIICVMDKEYKPLIKKLRPQRETWVPL